MQTAPSYNAAMDWLHSIALGAGLAWASGIRLYAVLFLAGAMAHFGYLALPPALEVLQHPLVLAAAALGQADPVWVMVAAIVGGAIASGAHLAKAGTRAVINTSPEPLSNWAASFGEDLLVPAGFLAAVAAPVVFLVLLAGFFAAAIWFVPKLFRALRRLVRKLTGGARAPG